VPLILRVGKEYETSPLYLKLMVGKATLDGLHRIDCARNCEMESKDETYL
jgi:hypothetical protein